MSEIKCWTTEELNQVAAKWNTSESNTARFRWWQNPYVVKELYKRYGDGITYESTSHFSTSIIASHLKGYLPFPTALSVGCGHGHKEMSLVVKNLVTHFTCYDLAPKRIDSARESAVSRSLSDRLDFICANPLDVEKRKFSLVFWDNALHHMPDAYEAIAWSIERLSDGGILFLNDFVGPSRFQWTDEMLSHCNSVMKQFEISPTVRPDPDELYRRDPSEAADSGKIREAFFHYFPQGIWHSLGGLLYSVGLNGKKVKLTEDKMEALMCRDAELSRQGLYVYAYAYAIHNASIRNSDTSEITTSSQIADTDQLDVPPIHMSPSELELLRTYYAKSTCYIEFGCGGSTFEALQFENIKSIYSIESDKAWVDKLKLYPLVADALQQKRLELIHVDIGPVKTWGAPAGPTHVTYWPDYYWGVWSQLPKNFDCLLIDGRFRVACTLMAALMCDPGHVHFLIHDFKGRPEYHILHKYFQEVASADQLSVFLLRESVSARNLLQDLHDYLFVPRDRVSQRQDICNAINDAFEQLHQQKQHHITLKAQYKWEIDHIKSQWQKEVGQLQKQAAHEKNLRIKFKRSFSWRLTAPFRAVGRLVKGKKK